MNEFMGIAWKEIAKRLRTERESRHLNQSEVAARVKLGQSYIGKIERGEQVPPADTLFTLITDGLGMSLGAFFLQWIEKENDLERYAKRIILGALRDSRRDLALDLLETLKKNQAPRVK